MPIAFFTRTRTGALVSRLNNDVIGAQRAFSDTLSGVVGNLVALALTLVVMLSLSWQITLLALVLLPIFVLPARRMGRRLARMELEAANYNSTMSTQMTERFSAPGATLVKLFARPERESAEFGVRASRVRDIGVRTAMVQTVFMTALTLVSALALALVYGLGGFYALQGSLDPGTVVTLALLITRLYAPLTGLASARVEVMSALVSFERVFEILDLKPLITEKPDARSVPPGPVAVEFDHVSLRLPVGGQGVAGLAGGGVHAGHPRRGRGDPRHLLRGGEPGQMVALVGSSGAGKSTIASLLARLYDVGQRHGVHRRRRRARPELRLAAPDPRPGHPGRAPVPRVGAGEPAAGQRGRRRGRAVGGAAAGPAGRPGRLAARRAGHRGGGARLSALRRRAAAADHRPAAAGPPAGGDPGRGDRPPGLHLRAGGAGGSGRGPGRPDRARHRAPALHRGAADQILVVEDGRIVERGRHDDLLAAGGRYAELYRTQFERSEQVSELR